MWSGTVTWFEGASEIVMTSAITVIVILSVPIPIVIVVIIRIVFPVSKVGFSAVQLLLLLVSDY